MKDIAVCVSGQFRKVDFTKTIACALAENLDCDVFIDTWSEYGSTSAFARLFPLKTVGAIIRSGQDRQRGNDVAYLKSDFPHLNELFYARKSINPGDIPYWKLATGVNVEHFPDNFIVDPELHGKRVPTRMVEHNSRSIFSLPMFYKIWSCDRQRRAHEERRSRKYKKVVRIRPDISYDHLDDVVAYVNHVHCEMDHVYVTSDERSSFVSDMFAVANSETMTKYASTWDHLDRYWCSAEVEDVPTPQLMAERTLFRHFQTSGLVAVPFDIDVGIELNRFTNEEIRDALVEDIAEKTTRSGLAAVHILDSHMYILKLREADGRATAAIFEDIERYFARRRADNEKYPYPSWAAAIALRKMRRKEEAIKLEEAILDEFDTLWPRPCLDVVGWQLRDGRMNDAEASLARVLRSFPDSAPVLAWKEKLSQSLA